MTSIKPEDRIHFVDAIILKLADEADAAKVRFALIPKLPKSSPPECRALWAGAGFNFIFAQYFASLSVCGAFVECFLERAIPDFCEKAGLGTRSVPTDLYDQIKMARSIGLISKDDEEILQDFRKLIRNRFAHGDVVAAADSLMSIQTAGEVSLEAGETKIHYVDDKLLAILRQETMRHRLDYVSEMFAPPVIRWIGNWARRCAKQVWGST